LTIAQFPGSVDWGICDRVVFVGCLAEGAVLYISYIYEMIVFNARSEADE